MTIPLPPIHGERRPIASRNHALWRFTADQLVRLHVSANLISVLGMLAAFLAGAALVATSFTSMFHARILFFAAAVLIQARLVANMLDGMVAIASGKASPLGELFNEIPDRLSDTAILAAAGYAALSDPVLGWIAAAVALFITYLRAFGKTCGVSGLFIGPMAKSHRMFTLTLCCLFIAIAPASVQPIFTLPWPAHPVGIMAITLAVIILGGIFTALRRLAHIVHALKERR